MLGSPVSRFENIAKFATSESLGLNVELLHVKELAPEFKFDEPLVNDFFIFVEKHSLPKVISVVVQTETKDPV